MKRKTKIAVWIAVILIVVGAGIFAAALSMGGANRSAAVYELHTYEITDNFSSIVITSEEADIRLTESEDGACRVICSEDSKLLYEIGVSDETLCITCEDDRRWFDRIPFFFDGARQEVVLSLPRSDWDGLQLKSISGDMDVPAGFTFASAALESTSGDISFCAAATGVLRVETVSGDIGMRGASASQLSAAAASGDIVLEEIAVQGLLEVNAVSGDSSVQDGSCGRFCAGSTSGEITCKDLTVLHDFFASAVSGDIALMHCDAESMEIETVSGDIAIPRTTSDGVIELTTVSGDIVR